MTYAKGIVTSLAVVLAVATGAPRRASAQTMNADALIEQGLAARRERRDEDALALFRRAHELSPTPRALAQVALAEQATDRWLEARGHLAEALTTQDPWIEERRAALSESLVVVESRLGRLVIEGGEAGARVRIDGVTHLTLPVSGPVWVTPGRVRVEVTGSDGTTSAREVDVVRGERSSVRVEIETRTAPQLVTPAQTSDGAPMDGFTVAGIVSVGLAAVGLAFGIGFHVARESDARRFQGADCEMSGLTRAEACPDVLSAVEASEVGMAIGYASAGAFAIASAVFFGLGARTNAPDTALSCGPGPGELSAACVVRF